VIREAQKVDLPAPAGPVTSTASVERVGRISKRGGEKERGEREEGKRETYIAFLNGERESY